MYTKTNWINDVTYVDAEKMNKLEGGVYNNALDLEKNIIDTEKNTSELENNKDDLRTTQNSPVNSNGAVFTIVDDDTTWLYPQWWNPILTAKNINITLACITGKIGTGGYMTLQQLKDAQTAGQDIVSHTTDTTDFGSLSSTIADTTCKDSQQWLKDNGFNGYNTLVYPGGLLSTNVTMKNVARKYYKYGIATWDADMSCVNSNPVDNWALKRIFITHTLSELQTAVDVANTNKQWLILLTHSSEFVQADANKVSSLIDYVKSKNIPILKFSEAVKLKGNAVALGEYTDVGSTFIGINGSMKSSIKPTLIVNKTPSTSTMSALMTTYPVDSITVSVLDSNQDTCINNGGTYTVFRSSAGDLYSYALFYPYQYNRMYSRRWDFTNLVWKAWEVFYSDKVLTTTIRQSLANGAVSIGEKCFDTTLSKPLWVKSTYPNVWVDGVGTVVA